MRNGMADGHAEAYIEQESPEVTKKRTLRVVVGEPQHLRMGRQTKQQENAVKNPFLMPSLGPGVQTIDSAGRIMAVKNFNAAQCRAALKLPDLQATVRQAIERRLRKLKA